MAHLAATYRHLGKYTEAKKLDIQAQKIKNKVPGAESPLMNSREKVHSLTNLAKRI
ncbi:uncharacterized protein LACBIDRAFT_299429 [Laccaria bicolor S238N-H82]|uniref:Predicted protein n=1 Tax=Laccaria bicolor (strain S238N-H82 / ATCC MYA-4686) TaxID=486041 RepID=B0DEP0_LACBS|nr:uncharacterized protein LACBIDRAFT_299429 [Laccaria bicolor S238N-H82]EDR07062.1 predicted protein [Laccaria bicolor S238N-H82]|eukprot:XP_001882435.1 predicted protein [Laccaria bicolor S238N-H82]